MADSSKGNSRSLIESVLALWAVRVVFPIVLMSMSSMAVWALNHMLEGQKEAAEKLIEVDKRQVESSNILGQKIESLSAAIMYRSDRSDAEITGLRSNILDNKATLLDHEGRLRCLEHACLSGQSRSP